MDTHKLFKVLVVGALLSVGCDPNDEGGEGDADTETGTETTDGSSEDTTDEGTSESTTDEGTTDEGTTDEGTTDEGTTDEGTTDEGTSEEGTTAETGGECCPEECWVGPCECTGGVCCWLVPADHPGCQEMC